MSCLFYRLVDQFRYSLWLFFFFVVVVVFFFFVFFFLFFFFFFLFLFFCFFFCFLFVQPILKVQTNNDNLSNCHHIEHNSAGGWRLCGVVWTFRCRFPAG